jgi:dynein heavy chain
VQENESKLTKLGAKLDKKDEVLDAAKAEIKAVSKQKNLIAALGNQSMLHKHWTNVWALVGGPPGTLEQFTLNQLLEAGIEEHFERVEEISAQAGGEAGILTQIAEITALWEETSFVVKNYRDTKDRFFITEIDDLIVQLEDH